jgi:putative ABC transport system substrate-binding protein
MRRRDVILGIGGLISAAIAARAQQKAMPVIGVLTIFSPPPNLADVVRSGPFAQGLSEAGFVEGQNVAFERRWAENHHDRLPALAAELVSHKVDVIVTSGTPSAIAAKSATSTIPIVFMFVADPVGTGLVTSLARPGSNATGFGSLAVELTPKRLELLCELVPEAKVIALLVNPNNVNTNDFVRYAQDAARTKRVQLPVLLAGSESEIDTAFASLVQQQADGLIVSGDQLFTQRREQVVALASRYAVPAIYIVSSFVAAGGLVSYGIDDQTVPRQAGIYAGRILKGEKPADLPVQQPTKFELVITSRPPRPWASPCRRRSSPAPPRLSNKREFNAPAYQISGAGRPTGGGRRQGQEHSGDDHRRCRQTRRCSSTRAQRALR